MPLDSEYELMQRLSAGNEDAFGELFGRYYPRVCAFVSCIVKEESTAEDIAQDIFLKTARHLSGAGRFVQRICLSHGA